MMTITRMAGSVLSVMALAVALCGCQSAPVVTRAPTSELGVDTPGLVPYDHTLVAKGIANKMIAKNLPKGYIVALGPVAANKCKYDVDVEAIQDKLEELLTEDGRLQFTTAIDAMSGTARIGTSEAGEAGKIYKLIEYNWDLDNPIDGETLRKFGKLAKINGLLFGKVTCSEIAPLPRGGSEVNYSFRWKLADVESGIILISHEETIRKNVR